MLLGLSKNRPECTCDEANQLVIALHSDPYMPLWLVSRRLQRPLQKLVCVLESAGSTCCLLACCDRLHGQVTCM